MENSTSSGRTLIALADAPLTKRHIWIVTVSCMEQIIGAGLSTLAGIIIPMINLLLHPELSSGMQGLAGAAGLTGIAIGSPIIGRMSDKWGYLFFFRTCPVIILIGSSLIFFTDQIWWTITGLFITGIGVGGGYSLDSAYIFDLMPAKWRATMVGVAKAMSALGFIGVALVSYIIIKDVDKATVWPVLSLTLAVPGLITFLLRIGWAQSPQWCLAHGMQRKAQESVDFFLGPRYTYNPLPPQQVKQDGFFSLFKGSNLSKVVFSGIPWACEGVGVYGVGVFLPVLVMSLGLDSTTLFGLPKISHSVILTTIINCFILIGFIIGLLMLRRFSHLKMLVNGFLIAAMGLAVILCAYVLHLPVFVSLAGFIVFELFLNIGPHLLTYIIPPHIFDPSQRAAGNGVAAFLGKAGAIGGVFLMPWLLGLGGMKLVLSVCIAFNLLGAFIAWLYGRKLYNE